MSPEKILLKRGLRSDWLWSNRFVYNSHIAKIAFRLDANALWKSQYWPREKLNALTQAQLKKVVEKAAQLPFWRERFAKGSFPFESFTMTDFARFPILTKQDLFSADIGAYTDSALLPRSVAISTSGSTGMPLTFYHDPGFLIRSSAISERLFRGAGDGKRYPIIVMTARGNMGFGFAPHIYFYVRGYTGVEQRLDEFLKECARFPDGVIVFGLSSTLLELARLCKAQNAHPPIRRILAAAESLNEAQRQEIQAAFGTEVRVSYGMSEVRRLGSECEMGRLHLNEESVFFEVIDREGSALPLEREGNLVVTGLMNTVMPFIRYKTGDRAILSEASCPCGRTLRTIQLQGRQTDFIPFSDGRSVALVDVSSMFDRFTSSVRRFQLVRESEFAFIVNVMPGPTFDEEKDKIAKTLTRIVHPSASFALIVVESIGEAPSGKAIYYKDVRNT